jgi:class 3 adenylate cyclase
MDLGEKVDPEEWYRIMDRFFQILSDGVHRFEGTVDKFTGDGIMAIFGAPIAHEDHARRACYAALHLKEGLRRYAEELKRTRELSFAGVARSVAGRIEPAEGSAPIAAPSSRSSAPPAKR